MFLVRLSLFPIQVINFKLKVRTAVLLGLLQLPIFISMYRAIVSTPQLLLANFAWISNLGSYDPFFILPLVVMIITYLQLRKNSAASAADSGHMRIMKVMPVLNFFFMATLPAGLVLYYATSSALQFFTDHTLGKVLA